MTSIVRTRGMSFVGGAIIGGLVCLAGVVLSAMARRTEASPTLRKIRAAGSVMCGINTEEAEYSTEDAHGNHSVFDVDICRAVAVAVLGRDARFSVVPYRAEKDALGALKSAKIDVLATGSLKLLTTANTGLGCSRPILYDYQGFLVNRRSGIVSAKDLAGKKVCFLGGTEVEQQLTGFMMRENVNYLPFLFQEEGEMEAAFVTRNCAAITADVTQLAYERIAFKNMAQEFEILPDVVAKDPLAVTYRMDDPQWATIVNWTVESLIQAEESGVTQSNVVEKRRSDDPVIQRLLGVRHGYGQYLGLDDAWASQVIAAVGNYGEMFERDLGSGSVMKLVRGANNLWTNGGLMVAAPMR